MFAHDELVKLALFCAQQAGSAISKDVAYRSWRMAVQYRDEAAKLGKQPDIGERPAHVAET